MQVRDTPVLIEADSHPATLIVGAGGSGINYGPSQSNLTGSAAPGTSVMLAAPTWVVSQGGRDGHPADVVLVDTPASPSAGSGASAGPLRQRTALGPPTWPALAAAAPVYTRTQTGTSSIVSAQLLSPQDRSAFTFRGIPSFLGPDANGYMRHDPNGVMQSTRPPWAVETINDAAVMEVSFGANGTAGLAPRWRLIVDQFDGAGPRVVGTYNDPGGVSPYLDKFDWTAAGGKILRYYRLEFEGNFRYGGMFIGPEDVSEHGRHEDLTVVIGDSFTEPTIQDSSGAVQFAGDGLASVFGRLLGLRNCIPMGRGGTGYLNPGTAMTFRTRFINDLVNAGNKPARIFFMGGINDANREPTYTGQMLHDECVTLFKLARSAFPDAEIGVFSPWCSNGQPTVSLYTMGQAIRQAVIDAGLTLPDGTVPYYDLLGTVQDPNRVSGLLTATTTNVSNIQCDTKMPAGSYILVGRSGPGSGWNGTLNPMSFAKVSSSSGAAAPYTINLTSAVAAGIPVGSPVVTIGRPWVPSGTGHQGATNNTPADVLIGPDATHPTMEGHTAGGRVASAAHLSKVPF